MNLSEINTPEDHLDEVTMEILSNVLSAEMFGRTARLSQKEARPLLRRDLIHGSAKAGYAFTQRGHLIYCQNCSRHINEERSRENWSG